MPESSSSQKRLGLIIAVIVLVVSIGTTFYHYVENLKWLDSIYFSVITLTTVGYGDITPHTDPGKIFTIFYVLIGVGIIAASLNLLVRHAAEQRIERHNERAQKRK